MKKDEPMRNINPFGLRMQPDLREMIERSAERNHRSLNAEIVARLEESFIGRPADEQADQDHPIATGPGAQELVKQLQDIAKMFRDAAEALNKPKENP